MKILFFISFVFICFISLQAQWSSDPTVNNPICTAVGAQTNPAIASDDSGVAIITWGDARTYSYDIYAQRIGSDGTVRWTSNGVAICTGTTQGDPSIISNGNGGAIIAWMDFRDSNLGLSIYAQKINAQGKVMWAKNGIKVIHAFPHEEPPVITTDDSGGVIITWDELNK